MFPHVQYPPARTTQRPRHKRPAFSISRKSPTPEHAIILGLCGVLGAAVPETAIHKKSEPHLPGNKIWFSKYRLMPPPAGDFVPSQQTNKRDFRILVPAPANARHHFRPLCFVENVSHLLLTADYAVERRFGGVQVCNPQHFRKNRWGEHRSKPARREPRPTVPRSGRSPARSCRSHP